MRIVRNIPGSSRPETDVNSDSSVKPSSLVGKSKRFIAAQSVTTKCRLPSKCLTFPLFTK